MNDKNEEDCEVEEDDKGWGENEGGLRMKAGR